MQNLKGVSLDKFKEEVYKSLIRYFISLKHEKRNWKKGKKKKKTLVSI